MLVVSGEQSSDFAVVGSGNLSAGGFRDNVECSLFTDDQELVSDLSGWFDEVSETLGAKLEEPVIRLYEPLYKKYQSHLRKLAQQQSIDLVKIDKKVEATLHDWKKAVSDAKAFFGSAEFVEQGKKCQDAIRRIRASLNYPRFTFNYDGWQEFLDVREFGNLAPIQLHKQKLLSKLGDIGKAFRVLVDDNRKIFPRLEEVLSGTSKVEFIGRNVLTKVLAAHDGKSWPVYNAKVEGVLRKQYGYWIPRGLTEAQKYLAYAKLMREFAMATGAGDVYALDRFFLHRSQQP